MEKALDKTQKDAIMNIDTGVYEQIRCQNKYCNKLFFEHEIVYGTVVIKCPYCNKKQKFTFNAL